MSKAGKYYQTWWGLSWSAKITFLKATVVLVFISLGLKILPFSTFRNIFRRMVHRNHFEEVPQSQIDQTVWAVDTAANILPIKLLCLPRALATKYLLRKVPFMTLEIGVEMNIRKKFEAHAWIEKNGRIIIGDWPNSLSYQRLWVWD